VVVPWIKSIVVRHQKKKNKKMKRNKIIEFLKALNIEYEEWNKGVAIKIECGSVTGDGWAGLCFYFDENDNYKTLEITSD